MTAQRKLRPEPQTYTRADVKPRPRLADSTNMARDHEAVHLLHDRLTEAFATKEPKWSPRQTATFAVVTCGGFWLGAATLLHAILH